MQPEHPAMIAQTIQLALAPVFVLVAIGNIMNILTTRLAARALRLPPELLEFERSDL